MNDEPKGKGETDDPFKPPTSEPPIYTSRRRLHDEDVVKLEREESFSGRFRIIPQMLRGRHALFDDIAGNRIPYQDIFYLALVGALCLALYGFLMGTYNLRFFPGQPFTAALKLPMVFFISLIVCLPALFITNIYLGMGLRFRQILALFMVAIAVTGITAACLSTICLFFRVIIGGEGRYNWMLLINITLLGISGIMGLVFLNQGIGFLVRRKSSELGRVIRAKAILRVWMVVYVTVTVMLTWQLRPYLCRDGQPWVWARSRGNHFLHAVAVNVGQLTGAVKTDRESARDRYHNIADQIERSVEQQRVLDEETIPKLKAELAKDQKLLLEVGDNKDEKVRLKSRVGRGERSLGIERVRRERLEDEIKTFGKDREELAADYETKFDKPIE